MQYYWTQWYAGYYSSYYSDYYGEFFAKNLENLEYGEGAEAYERFHMQTLSEDETSGQQQEMVLEPVTKREFPEEPDEY